MDGHLPCQGVHPWMDTLTVPSMDTLTGGRQGPSMNGTWMVRFRLVKVAINGWFIDVTGNSYP